MRPRCGCESCRERRHALDDAPSFGERLACAGCAILLVGAWLLFILALTGVLTR